MNTDLCFDYGRMKAIAIEDMNEIKRCLALSDFPSCEYTFPNLYIWADVYGTVWQIFNGHFYVHLPSVDELFFPCSGDPVSIGELAAVSRGMRARSFSGTIAHVPPSYIATHPELQEYFTAVPMGDDNDEYIYQTKSLAELHGGKLSKKRNLISQFERNYDNFEIKKIEKEDFRTVISLTEHWRLEHLDDTRVENERKAINRALNHYCELGFEGLMLMAGGELKAYAVFSRINSNSYTVQFEKADLECKGASQVITNQTAKYLLDKCEFINREQDLGIEGLRHAKQSYMPILMLKDYYLVPKA